MRCAIAVLTMSLAACGGDGGAPVDAAMIDAAVIDAPPIDARPIDARPIDARPIDAPIDAVPTARLTVEKVGAGDVASQPPGIACGAACSASFPIGTDVRLTTSAPNGVTFTGWSGPCSGTGDCDVTIAADTTVTATFTGVPCADECTAGQGECPTLATERTCGQYDTDTCAEWSAPTACTGMEECRLGRCGGAYLLTVAPLGEGMTLNDIGTVTSMPAGIQCGRNGMACQVHFPDDAQVTLTATSDATAVFDGWSLIPLAGTNGMHCVGSTDPCTVTMNVRTTLAALYCSPECTPGEVHCASATTGEFCGEHDGDACLDLGPTTACPGQTLCTATGCMPSFTATATTAGQTGQVALDGMTCALVPCSRSALVGQSITVTAIPAPENIFTGWTGACTGTGPCVLTGTGTATANFADRCISTATPDQGYIFELELGASNVYWTRSLDAMAAVMRMPTTGGPPEILAQASFSRLVADEPALYWIATADVIQRYEAGVVESVVTDAFLASPGLNATHIFYRRGATLKRAHKTGGPAVELAASLPISITAGVHLLADATRAYWGGGGSVIAIPVDGGAPVTLASSQGDFNDLVQDATHIYWNPTAKIVRVPKAGGAVETVVMSNSAIAASIAVHGNTLVWYASDGVYATTIGSGVIQRLRVADALNTSRSVAIDANAVYFVSQPGGGNTNNRIVTLARDANCAPP